MRTADRYITSETFNLPVDVVDAVERAAASTGRSVDEVIADALAEQLPAMIHDALAVALPASVRRTRPIDIPAPRPPS